MSNVCPQDDGKIKKNKKLMAATVAIVSIFMKRVNICYHFLISRKSIWDTYSGKDVKTYLTRYFNILTCCCTRQKVEGSQDITCRWYILSGISRFNISKIFWGNYETVSCLQREVKSYFFNNEISCFCKCFKHNSWKRKRNQMHASQTVSILYPSRNVGLDLCRIKPHC